MSKLRQISFKASVRSGEHDSTTGEVRLEFRWGVRGYGVPLGVGWKSANNPIEGLIDVDLNIPGTFELEDCEEMSIRVVGGDSVAFEHLEVTGHTTGPNSQWRLLNRPVHLMDAGSNDKWPDTYFLGKPTP